jgi:FkbM family methyltransferase
MMDDIFKDLLNYFSLGKDKNFSQANQDLFVLYFTHYAGKKGFYVEIGAADGIRLSNTYLLEKAGWQGIIVDPVYYSSENIKLRKCIKDNRAVYSKSGLKLPFLSVENNPESRISQFEHWSGILEHIGDYSKTLPNKIIDVETVSLNDLLEQYNAPNKIDYISIDTEGAEFEIINNFDFNKYDVEILTIEHNHANFRKDVIKLLNDKGYFRLPNDRQGGFVIHYEDWFIKNNNPVLKKLLNKF